MSQGKQSVDLRIYDLCRNKLLLSEGDAATASLEIQEVINEEKEHLLQQQANADRSDRKDWEEFMEQRIDFLRSDFHTMHLELREQLHKHREPTGHQVEILQWMFTYFAFLMGGIIVMILLLLK